MAVNKKNLPAPREMPIDPAVEAAMTGNPNDPIYGNLDRRRKARNMTDYQRRKLERDRNRSRLSLEIDPALRQRLDVARTAAQVPPADLVGLLLHLGLEAIQQGQIDLDDYRYHSNLPRYPYRLIWDKSDE